MICIVLDTNVLVSALLNPAGVCARIWALVLNDRVTLCVDQRMLHEYYAVLCRREFGFDVKDVNDILAFIEDEANVITPSPLKPLTHDAHDQPFIETALAVRADFLVTGNLKHFSGLQKYGLQVVSPKQFLDHFLLST